VQEYRCAATRLVESGRGAYEAAEMLLHRARLVDMALEYYRQGWQQRPRENCVPCAIRLAQLAVQKGDVEGLLALLPAAEDFLHENGSDTQTADFYNELAQLAEQPLLANLREDLRDRALLGLAAKMR